MYMKRLFLTFLAALTVAAPAFSKDKAPKNEKVKNVILLIGDGMGLAAAAAWMIDQDYQPTCFDRAQYVGISKTYSLNNRVTDSAASGTTMGTGFKTNNSMLGMLPDGTTPENLTEFCHKIGKQVGIIVTSTVQDATPGAFYAHAKSRGDAKTIQECFAVNKPDILMGGGLNSFLNHETEEGNMVDKAKALGYTFCETPEDFLKVQSAPVLGLYAEGGFPMVIDRDSDYLADMTNHTMELLGKNKKGFFMMVEGSHIDHAAHANNTEQLIFELEEFDKAVNAAFDYADTHKGTLVIVTGDHETGGIALVSGNKDFHKGDSGINVVYSTSGHTGSPLPIYAYGANAWKLGHVMENTQINKIIRELLGK